LNLKHRLGKGACSRERERDNTTGLYSNEESHPHAENDNSLLLLVIVCFWTEDESDKSVILSKFAETLFNFSPK
jgi:hypothetical protein